MSRTFGAGDVGEMRVEQRGESAQDARLRLAAQAEQDEVVPREDGVDDLRDDGVFVADDAGEERRRLVAAGAGRAQAGDEVLAELVFDAAGEAGWGEFAGAEGAESCGKGGRHG